MGKPIETVEDVIKMLEDKRDALIGLREGLKLDAVESEGDFIFLIRANAKIQMLSNIINGIKGE